MGKLITINSQQNVRDVGYLNPSNLQMLTGALAALRPAYRATGRIGYAQKGVPTSEDYAFGTGVLIAPNLVMTNGHVEGLYGHYLRGDGCGGIEFLAEKGNASSDFYAFNGSPPILLPGLDIAIFRLAQVVQGRAPLGLETIPVKELDQRKIAVIGYPDSFTGPPPNLMAALEIDPVLAVKRMSFGNIFRHSSDTSDPYGIEMRVPNKEQTYSPMHVICHNAVTMSGCSGAPILDLKTGRLLGIHFAGHTIFNGKEPANLGMTIAQIKAHAVISVS